MNFKIINFLNKEYKKELKLENKELKSITWGYMLLLAYANGWDYIWKDMDKLKQEIFLEYADEDRKSIYMKKYYKEY